MSSNVRSDPQRPDAHRPAEWPRKGLVGLIGAGIQRSLSPALHENEAAAQGLRLHYQLIDLDRARLGTGALPGLLQAVRAMGFLGVNITYPCKQAVMPLLDDLSDEARAIGAVNTVVCREGRLHGHNTDGSGWAWGFQRALPQADLSRIVLLGCGGAGAAVADAVLRLGAGELRLVDVDGARPAELSRRLAERFGTARVRPAASLDEAMPGASGLIHATPTGMDKLPGSAVPVRWLVPGLWVSEVVYFPLQTELVRQAQARGCAVIDGGGMAVGQAIGAFERFTGLRADPQRMAADFRRLISASQAERLVAG